MYACLPAPTGLDDLVEGIWIQEDSRHRAPRSPAGRVLPTGTVELIFNYGDPIVHVEPDGNRTMPEHYFTGQRTRAVIPVVDGQVGILLVSLYPWGLRQLIPVASAEVDAYADLQHFLPHALYWRFVDAFHEARDCEQRLGAVTELLLQLRRSNESIAPSVHAAVNSIAFGSTSIRVARLADQLGLSRRQLTRSFHDQIGLPTKRFARVMRFQRALGMRRSLGLGWAEIAACCGYSDQAHLSHEFHEISGLAPTEIGPARPHLDQVFNDGQASRFFHTVYL